MAGEARTAGASALPAMSKRTDKVRIPDRVELNMANGFRSWLAALCRRNREGRLSQWATRAAGRMRGWMFRICSTR
jgi:hypothetical protein